MWSALFLLSSVLAEEDVVPTESHASEDYDFLELIKEWNQHFIGFQPTDMINFDLPSQSDFELYNIIDTVPTNLQGSWFASNRDSKNVDFVIMDPGMAVIFEKKSKSEALFRLEISNRGLYTFKFTNRRLIQSVTITLAMKSGNSTNEMLTSEHLDPVEKKLIGFQQSVKDFQVENTYAQLRQEGHFGTVASANRNVFWISIAECLGIIFVTVWQVYYIKKLLDNRRVL